MVDISFTMVMQWINFAILLFILQRVLFRPLMKFLDKRSKSIAGNIEEALDNKEKSLEVLDHYNTKLKGIRVEADKMFEDARKRAEKEKDKIIESAQNESRIIVEAAKSDIETESKKARNQLKSDISSLVVKCTSKILEREVGEEDHKRFIEEFLHL